MIGKILQNDVFTENDEYLWFISSRYGLVNQLSKKDWECEVILNLNSCFGNSNDVYRAICYHNGRLFIFPSKTRQIIIYDIINSRIDALSIPKGVLLPEENNWSANYIKTGTTLFFYWGVPSIVRYDLETNEWKVYRNINLIDKEIEVRCFITRSAFIEDNQVFIPIYDTPCFISINIETDEMRIVKIEFPRNETVITSSEFDGEFKWVKCNTIDGQFIYKVDYKFNICKEYDLQDISEEMTGPLVIGKSKIFLLPGKGDSGIILYKNNNKIEKLKNLPIVPKESLVDDWFSNFNYYRGFVSKKTFYVIHSWTGKIVTIDLENDKEYVFDISFSREQNKKIYSILENKKWLENHGFTYESKECLVKDLMKHLKGNS